MAPSFRAVLLVVLAAGVVVTGVAVLDDALEVPPAFCPADPGETEPQAESATTGPPENSVLLFEVDDGGEMTDRSDRLAGRIPIEFTDALVCQYQRESDEELGTCGGSTTLLATRYEYQVYDLRSRRFLGEFDLLGRCPTGIVELPRGSSGVDAVPDYLAVVRELTPLLGQV